MALAGPGCGIGPGEPVIGNVGCGNGGHGVGRCGRRRRRQGRRDRGGGCGQRPPASRTAGAGSCDGAGGVVKADDLRVTALVGQMARHEERQETARLLGREHRSTAVGSAGESTNVAIGIVVGDTVRHDNGSTAMADVFGTAPVTDCPGGPV